MSVGNPKWREYVKYVLLMPDTWKLHVEAGGVWLLTGLLAWLASLVQHLA